MKKLVNIFNAQQIDALKHVQNSINDILRPAGYETYIDGEHIRLLEGMPELQNVPLNIRPSKQTDLVLIKLAEKPRPLGRGCKALAQSANNRT